MRFRVAIFLLVCMEFCLVNSSLAVKFGNRVIWCELEAYMKIPGDSHLKKWWF